MSIEAEIEAHVAAITEAYRETITGPDAQIEGGSRLWGQFEDAVAAWRAKPSPQRVLAIIERVNELTVAGLFIKDDSIVKLEYEPRQAGLEGRIDFRLGLDMGKAAHAEVKTVQPQTDDSDENWEKYEERREHFTPGTNLIVQKRWMGAQLFGRSFSARAAFMRYTLEFEEKLEAVQAASPGSGCLIFCGNGIDWHPSHLEDFADFYRTGKHRPDDSFGDMERHHMQQNNITLRRNIHSFGCLTRGHSDLQPSHWIVPVRGPRIPWS
ncbi:hypothetical protein [Bradyrhizobium sp. DASA03120]|uniref:hypothetical protein n=1 Tax=Bradyrhizobium sp. SMVTL-02 TaxID=3395917 RepID=UPI003F72AE15